MSTSRSQTSHTDWTIRPGMLPGILEAAVDGSGATPRRTIRDWAVDIGSVLLALAMASVSLLVPQPQPLPHTAALIAAALASCSLLLRRRFPTGLTIVLVVASVWIPAASGASMIALFTAAVHRRLSTTLALVALAGMSAFVQFSLGASAPSGRSGYWLAVTGTILISLLVVGWGMAVRGRRELVLLMAERVRHLHAEQESRVRRAQQAVREGLARDLHDSLAHRLSLISMSAGALEYRRSVPADDLQEMVSILRSNAQHGLDELRQVVTVLRRPDGQAVVARRDSQAIVELVDEARAAGQRVELSWSIPVGELGPSTADSLFRCVQEGLTNARKHAPGQPVSVSGRLDVQGTEDTRTVIVSLTNPYVSRTADDGGEGLAGLQERVSHDGGRISISAIDGTFQLRLVLPVPEGIHIDPEGGVA